MAKLLEITGKAISGEWGQDDDTGTGIPVLRTTNFTNEGFVNYKNVVTRSISKKNIAEKYLRHGDVIIEKSKVEVQKALDQTQLLFDSLMQQYFG